MMLIRSWFIGLAICLLAAGTVVADNSARFVGPGVVGNALQLDSRNYVTFSGLGKLDQVTISLWVKPGRLSKTISAILNSPGWGKPGLVHLQFIDDGKVRVAIFDAAGFDSDSTIGLDTGKWQHIALTYDDRAQTCSLYVNGKLDTTVKTDHNNPIDLDSFTVGAWGRGDRGLAGAIDDLRIYGQALDAECVHEIFVHEGGDAYMVGHWTFDSLEGEVFADSSEGSRHDGKIAWSGPAPVKPAENITPKEIADLGITDIRHGFVSTAAADDWEHALITGNGVMGALVMSDALSDTIILSRHGLWLPLNKPLPPVDTASHLKEIRQMMSERKYQDAADYVVKLSHDEGWGYKRWTDPLVPAFDIKVDMHSSGETSGYLRGVNWQTGAAAVRWQDARGVFVRKVFVSRPDNVVVTQITGPGKGAADCDLSLAQHPGAWGVKEFTKAADGDWLTYRSSFNNQWPGSLQGYDGAARVIAKGGTKKVDGDRIIITGADEVQVVARVELNFDCARSKIDDIKKSLSAIQPDFAALLAKHEKIHGGIFNRVKFDLGGSLADHAIPSEDLIAKSQVGNLNKALLEKEFDACRYAILSSSGEAPPTLQGIWAGTYSPPWSSDYTQNGNLQSAIASELSTNMPEAMMAYFKYLESQLPAYRENAKRMYGARGIHVPSRTSSHGYNNHFDEVWPMTFWTAGAGWAAHFFYDYYLYTGDRDFLMKHALPFMKEAAAFYEDFLIAGPDGKYIFSPSYSPENNPSNSPSQSCVNATMDIAVCRELLSSLVTVCKEQRIERDKVKLWESMIAKLPDYTINRDGAVKEWDMPDLDDNYGHRHCSHLYALFDGMPADIENNPKLQAAFKKAADLRMDVRRQENGGIMAFGLVQLGLAVSSLRDAQASYDAVDWLANKFWFPNMATTHNPKELFNTDLSGGQSAIMVKMLVASQPGIIELLPALPTQWPTGKIEGLPCRGQVTVSSLEWKPGVVKVSLKSAKRQNVTLRLPSAIKAVNVVAGKARLGNTAKDNCRVIGLPAGKAVSLEIGL